MSALVVKDNGLINASYSLGLAEQRLILLAIVEARRSGKGLAEGSLLTVHAKDYAKQYKTDIDTAYQVLKDGADALMVKIIRYEAKSPMTGRMIQFKEPWANKSAYEPELGYVYIRFSDVVVPLITRLESQFTSYKIDNVSNLTSGYAIRLYETICSWREVGKTPKYKIDDIRGKLGVEPEQYNTMSNFKARVLRTAIKQVNDHTDLTVKYEQYKTANKITAISFSFKPKKSDNPATDDNDFIKMTESQIKLFSSKLANLPELGSNAPIGASTDDYANLIANELRNTSQQQKYHKYLSKVGYQSPKKRAS